MQEGKSSSPLGFFQKSMEFQMSLYSLRQLRPCEHFIENVAWTEDIACFIVPTILFFVFLPEVDFRGRIFGRTFIKGSRYVTFLVSGSAKVCDDQMIIFSNQKIIRFEISMENACIKNDLPIELM